MQGATQVIRIRAERGRPEAVVALYAVKLSQGWAVKVPASIIIGITMHQLGIANSIIDALFPTGISEWPGLAYIGVYGIIWVVDVLTGAGGAIMRDVKAGILHDVKKREFKSARLILGIFKALVHCGLLFGASAAGFYSPNLLGWLPEATFAFLVLTVTLSIIENWQRMGFGGPLLNAFARMLRRGGIDPTKHK